MATSTREDKFFKQLRFLISFNNPKVVALMAARGFDQDSLDEGWNLLREAAGWMFEIPDTENGILLADNSEMLTKLDAWENTWFDVADAALSRKFPIAHKKLFSNLTKTSGFGVDKKIRTFLDRIDDLTSQEGENEGQEIFALLEKRGLNSKERDYARQLLQEVSRDPMSHEVMVNPEVIEAKKRAEERLWDWYMDWRKTARTVVANEKLRTIMGIEEPLIEELSTKEPAEEESEFLNFLE